MRYYMKYRDSQCLNKTLTDIETSLNLYILIIFNELLNVFYELKNTNIFKKYMKE